MGVLAAAVIAVLASVSAHAASGQSCEQAVINLGQSLGAPAQIAGPAPPSLLSQFAVLRRPQTPSDLLPPFEQIDFSLAVDLGSYYAEAIRQIAPGQYLLIGHKPYVGVLPARCLPKSERAERPKLVAQEKAQAAALIYCVATLSTDTCWPVGNLTSEADIAEQELEGNDVQELVPDGVAGVALHYRNGARQTAAVSNNTLRFTAPPALVGPLRSTEEKIDIILGTQFEHLGRPLSRSQLHALAADQRQEQRAERQLVPSAVTWLNATGEVVRTLHPPLIPAPRKFLPDSIVKVVGSPPPSCPTESGGSSTICPQAIAGPRPANLLAQLAVLRRAQLPSDVLPAISEVSSLLPIELASYYPQATRLLARGIYLLVGNRQTALTPGSAVSVTEVLGGRAALRHQPRQSAPLTYCLATLINANCQPTSNLDSEADLAVEVGHGDTASELVPDGVASVIVRYRGGRTQTVAVADNLIQFAAPAAARTTVEAVSLTLNNLDTVLLNHPSRTVARRDRAALAQAVKRYTRALQTVVPASIVWRASNGTILRTLHPPLTDGFGSLGLATDTI